MRRNVLGERHPEVADGAAMLAYWSIQKGRLDEAEPLLDEALSIRKEAFGETHPKVASGLILKAGIQVETGRFEDGLRNAESARVILEEILPADHWRVAAAANAEGAALAGLGRYEEAEKSLLWSDGILAEAPVPGVAEQSRQRLVRLYELWGKSDKAEQILLADEKN